MTTYFWKELFIRFTASACRKLPSSFVFSYFPFGFEGRMWDLVVSVPDHCLSFHFGHLSLLLEITVSISAVPETGKNDKWGNTYHISWMSLAGMKLNNWRSLIRYWKVIKVIHQKTFPRIPGYSILNHCWIWIMQITFREMIFLIVSVWIIPFWMVAFQQMRYGNLSIVLKMVSLVVQMESQMKCWKFPPSSLLKNLLFYSILFWSQEFTQMLGEII